MQLRKPASTGAMLLAAMLTTSCASAISDAGCVTYERESRGVFGADAAATPIGVKRRFLVLDDAMRATCNGR